jgi:hypothetical protein
LLVETDFPENLGTHAVLLEVDQTTLQIWIAIFDEGKIGQVHTNVRNQRWGAIAQHIAILLAALLWGHQFAGRLQALLQNKPIHPVQQHNTV